jgi:tetratricopeptide (TPR) repeat protein
MKHIRPGKRFFVLLLLLISAWLTGYPQIFNKLEPENTDSLKNLLNQKQGLEKLEVYFGIAEGYQVIRPDSSLKYATIAWDLAEKTDNPEIIAKAGNLLGMAWYYKGSYDKSIEHLLEAAGYFLSVSDTARAYKATPIIALNYIYSRNFEALKQYIKEVERNYVPFIRDTMELYFIISGIGWAYSQSGDYELSNIYYDRSFGIAAEYPVGPALEGHFHSLKGLNYGWMHDYVNALKSYKTANRFRGQANLPPYYNYLGGTYFQLDSLDLALHYYQLYFNHYDEKDRIVHFTRAYLDMGKIWLMKGRKDLAEEYYHKALSLAEWMYENKRFASTWEKDITTNYMTYQSVGKYREDQALELISNVRYELYRLYDQLALKGKALDEFIRYHDALIKLNNFEQMASIEEIRNRYEADKKEQTIAALSRDKELNDLRMSQFRIILIALIGLLLLGVIVAVLLVRMIRLRAGQRALVLEQKLMRSQLNPHFIFNSLASIQNKIILEEPELATTYMARFSQLFRNILEGSAEESIPLYKEIETAESYLELQSIRFAGKFTYMVEVDQKLDTENLFIPPMLTQPFIENAIEHGIKNKPSPGKISVMFKKQNGHLEILIEDDGIGRKKSNELRLKFDNDHKSLATSITQERIKVINKKLKNKITMEIIDLKDEDGNAKGTLVRFKIPC